MTVPNNKVGKLHLDKSFVNKLEILYKDKKKKITQIIKINPQKKKYITPII